MSAFGYNEGSFFTGSISFNSNLFRGFVVTQDTVADQIAFGSGSSLVTLDPKLSITAGTNIPVKLNGFIGTGSFIAYR